MPKKKKSTSNDTKSEIDLDKTNCDEQSVDVNLKDECCSRDDSCKSENEVKAKDESSDENQSEEDTSKE